MDVGMLWLDDDKKATLEEKVGRAADYYRQKYGRSPELCLVNKKMLAAEVTVGEIDVRPAGNVLPDHFWMGVRAS
jgi:hypothetical protein